jgi:creatinine amidohydrolase
MIRAVAEREGSLAILPVGALEQHGPHQPVLTDTQTAVAAAHAAARLVADELPVLVLPALWAGMSEHHIPFGGTISLNFTEFRGVIRGVVRSLRAVGFRRLLIVSGHGGNNQALELCARELAVEFGLPIVTTHPWSLETERTAAVLEVDKHLKHACEGETSMMMSIAPAEVRSDRFDDAVKAMAVVPGRDGFHRFWSFLDRSPVTGTWGDPRTATREKGERILQIHAEALANAMRDDTLWTKPADPWVPDRARRGP